MSLTAVMTILGEASGEPFEGQVAVARVIRERARRRKSWPDKVCLEPKQFSFWNEGKEKALKWLDKNTKPTHWSTAERAWEASGEGFVNWATHYHSVKVKPSWAPSMRFVGKIGNHLFYLEGGTR